MSAATLPRENVTYNAGRHTMYFPCGMRGKYWLRNFSYALKRKKSTASWRRRICVCVARSEGRCNDKINLAWRQIWILMFHLVIHVANCARQILTRLTKRILLSMLEKVLFIVLIRFHLFMRRFRHEFASAIKKKKRNIHNTGIWEMTREISADKRAVRFNCQYASLHR